MIKLIFQSHNAIAEQTYFLAVNRFADRTLAEITQTLAKEFTGLGMFSSDPVARDPRQISRGQLPVNPGAPRAVDTEQDCRTPVTEEQQQLSATLRHRADLRFGLMRNVVVGGISATSKTDLNFRWNFVKRKKI